MSSTTTASGGMNLIGVNISGGEFGTGTAGTNYVYPNTQEIDYYASQGMTVFRLPYLIENLEQTPGGPLNQSDLQQLQSIVAYAATKGMDVILDPHDYGSAWGNEILPGNTTESQYDNFLTQFASAFKGYSNVIFEEMNEPNQQSAQQQGQIAQDALNAIRAGGANQEVLLDGTSWDGAWT